MRIENLENLKESIQPVEEYLNSFLNKTDINSLASKLLTNYFEQDRDYLFSVSGTQLAEEDIPKYLEALLRMEGLISIVNRATIYSFPQRVRNWASDRLILTNGTVEGQLLKLEEEYNELLDAVRDRDETEQKDAIGDISTVLVILSTILGYKYEDCLESAWDEIKDRRGQLINGVFVKEE